MTLEDIGNNIQSLNRNESRARYKYSTTKDIRYKYILDDIEIIKNNYVFKDIKDIDLEDFDKEVSIISLILSYVQHNPNKDIKKYSKVKRIIASTFKEE